MSWDAPPADLTRLQSDVEKLKSTLETILQILDPVILRCLIDVFILKQGFTSQDGPRGIWVSANKINLSQASGIPEDEIVDFLQDFRDLGDDSAHTFRADEVALAIGRIPTAQVAQAHFKTLFRSLITHSVEQELDEGNKYTTRLYGGRLPTPGDRVRRARKV